MIFTVGIVAVVAVAVLMWFSVGRGVLRVGYVAITDKPSPEGRERVAVTHQSHRHQGVVHLVMVDHVDPGLVLIVLRFDGGGQWISTVRVDQQGFGRKRLDSWRAEARRVVVVEKPRAHEVIFRPLAARPARPVLLKLHQRVSSVGTGSKGEGDPALPALNDAAGKDKPIPRLRLLFALLLGVISVVSSVVLMGTDGVRIGVSWTHHAGVSAAPLLLVAGALLAISVALPPTGRTAILRVVTVAAFATWGLSQLLPNTGAGTFLDDVAILLFVIDAGVFVASESASFLRPGDFADGAARAEPAHRSKAPEAGRAA